MIPSYASTLSDALASRPALASFLTLYACCYWASGRAISRPAPYGPRWLAAWLASFFTWVMRVVGKCPITMEPPEKPLDASRQTAVVWHPHGAYTTMCFMHCAQFTVAAQPLQWYPGVAPVLFKLPFFREMLLLLNARSVDRRSLEAVARAGHNIGIQPGGIPEQLLSNHRREIALFPRHLGFVRLAVRHGIDLLPVYIFGENQAYHTFGHAGQAFSAFTFKWLGVPLVPVTGRFGLPWLVPLPTRVHVRWGNAVPVGPPTPDPTDDQVQAVFDRYLAELRRVFDAHKDACLPAEVAAKGLTVIFHGRGAAGGPSATSSKL